ncbi:hypothetical protein [Vibrio harveyi]|uniref:hypothetical protein n=1 Tax=Vibrio harveyi TaxID=669 RepID=UPI003D72B9E3
MKNVEEKAQEIKALLNKHTREQLSAKIERKTGARISGSTITRASSNKDIKPNMLHLIHYILTH